MKPSSRYSSYDARSSTSSHLSDPSSSAELKHTMSSRAVVKSKPSDPNITTMVKTFMENRSISKAKPMNVTGLVIPSDLIAGGLKKPARNGSGSNFAALGRKLFGKGTGTTATTSNKKKEVKALTEVKANTRTLAMVLRSERELLSLNKEQELEISELKLMLQEKNREVDKLKDLCLKQREEIKSLKNAILFPDVVNSQLQELLEKQGSELKQAKQVIPNLQRQVTSLTGQLQCIAEDLAEVKADKFSVKPCFQCDDASPRTPTYDDKEFAKSLEFNSDDPTSPGSPDDMFLKDLNPCLTPYYAKTKSKVTFCVVLQLCVFAWFLYFYMIFVMACKPRKQIISQEFDEMGYDSPYGHDESLTQHKMKLGFNSCAMKLSRSSDCCQKSETESRTAQVNRRSGDGKRTYGKQIRHKFI